MNKGQWTELFRSGNYGAKGVYSNDDLDAMVGNFNREDQVPIVVGHPKNDSPAWGWLGDLRRVGDVLQGRVADLHNDFSEALAAKKFKNRSVRIARTDKGAKLLHLGFLGGALPHVEGLKQAAQFDGDAVYIDFDAGEPGVEDEPKEKESEMDKDKRIKELEDKLAGEQAARKKEQDERAKKESEENAASFSSFVENELVAKGKLPKGEAEKAVAFMMNLPAGSDEKADFSIGEGDEQKKFNAVQWFKDFACRMPAADFASQLPDGEEKDFSRKEDSKLVDFTGCV